MHCSPPGSSVHGILQVRIPVWLLCHPPGDLPDPGMEPWSLRSPALAGGFFITSAIWKDWPVPETAQKWDDRFIIRDFKTRAQILEMPNVIFLSRFSLHQYISGTLYGIYCYFSLSFTTEYTVDFLRDADGPLKVEDSLRVTFSITRSLSEQTVPITSI